MKKDNSITKILALFIGAATILPHAGAQTVLSGDHVIEGDLEVGTTGQQGGLTIKGQTGGNANPGIRVTGDGGVVFEGTLGQGTIPMEGAGARLMWYPGKAAFRVGSMSSTSWNDQSIGQNSTAFGGSMAYGNSSTAMSGGRALSDYSTAMSGGSAWGDYSTVMSGAEADGIYNTAMSRGMALGEYSTAMSGGEAWGYFSTAMSGGVVYGASSVAAGEGIWSSSFRSVVLGSFNHEVGSYSQDVWVPTEPIFVVGNGTGKPSDPPAKRNSNALVILKNGDIQIPKRQGDILMGEFGNPEP